ncbi:endonuclease [Candidatus Pacearchaeota archaeon]|nr:endonuclease [Candidatus Pacearchaeota archaeon]
MYVVECSDATLYTGITTDISRRIREHNRSKRGAKYTRSRRPVMLVLWARFESRSIAARAECKFKKLSRSQKLKKIMLADRNCEVQYKKTCKT